MNPHNNNSNSNGANKKRGKGRRQRLPKHAPAPCDGSSDNNSSDCDAATTICSTNFVAEAGPGCYIARRDVTTTNSWLLEWEDVDPNDYEEEDVEDFPEIAIDPDECTLTLCNWDAAATKVAYITVFLDHDKGLSLRGRDGTFLRCANSTDNQGMTRACVTFIVLCPPQVFCHLCVLVPPESLDENISLLDLVDIESDIQEWNRHNNIDDTHSQRVAFPLLCGEPHPASYLCTQGEGGYLTHFFAGNQHAIDFACPIGTPLLAVGDGVVVDVQDQNILSGIAVTNLFQWNSIMLQLDNKPNGTNHTSDASEGTTTEEDPLFVEYVHIQHKSAKVNVGERVTKGQVIACGGSIGFSPEPHLHFCAYRSRDAAAPTVRVYLEPANGGDPFLPRAGIRYDANGPIVTATTSTAITF